MAIVGHVYIQPSSSDPGAVGYGYQWRQTDTGLIKERNLTNSAWVDAGSANKNGRGFASRGGANFCGPITGTTGLMPTDASAAFTNTPSVNNTKVALATDIQAAVDSLTQIILNLTGQAAPDVATTLTGNILTWTGSMDPGATWDATLSIPITTQTYGDGSEVQASDCIPFVWPNNASVDDVIQGFNLNFVGQNIMQYQCYATSTTNGTRFPAGIGYTVIAIKSGA